MALSPGQPSPDFGVWLSTARAAEIGELAAEGKRAREGAYAMSNWKLVTLIATTAIAAALQTYREVKRK